jgi:para-nitrobenzyl esterase
MAVTECIFAMSERRTAMKPTRRDFFRTIGTGVAGLSAGPALASSACSPPGRTPANDDQILFIGDDIAVRDTTHGRVRGYVLRDVYHFLGVPYGADTSGANRFMPPRPPEPWDDVFPAVWWGNSAPQNMENRYAYRYQAFADHWNYDDVSEACLAINVWTPAYGDGAKRPVLVWLHGGGFTNGNGIEQDGYNGENLSRFGDVVFCSLNHRLGPLGFANLAGVGGDAYAASGNVGMLDIVAALEWVRNNIEHFGGNPDNVTIMGQSGGGVKVTTLTAMPAAHGLFHKAVVLSGASLFAGQQEHSEGLGAYVLREAGLTRAQVGRLQQLPWREYYDIATRASRRFNAEMGGAVTGMRRGFGPVVDGHYLPQHPYYPEPTPLAANIPMLICSTVNEMSPSRDNAALEDVTLPEVAEQLRERAGFGPGLGDAASEVVDAYASAFPDMRPVEIWSLIASNRKNTVALADAKALQPAPVYVAWFGWQPPNFDGRQRAFHCSDICFWFSNTDRMLTHTGGGRRPRALSESMAGALLQFMRTGDPNGGGLPTWPRYTSHNGETMVLDDVPEVKNDPDGEARRTLPS